MSLRAHHLPLALILAGCSVADADELFDEPALDDETSLDEPSIDARALHGQAGPMGSLDACPGARIVGKLSAANLDCNPGNLPSGWSAIRLFQDGSPALTGLGTAPAQLQTFCAYEWSDPDPTDNIDSPNYNALHYKLSQHDATLANTAAPDCRGQRAQGAGLGDPNVGISLRAAFRTNIGAVSEQDLAATSGNRTPVDIAVADTISAYVLANNATPVNDHGLQMGQLIEGITCPGGDAQCLDDQHVRYTLAMPRNDWESSPDWQLGGQTGTLVDMALAIYEAVAEWQQRWNDPAAVDPAPRLVVNLSVAFDSHLLTTEQLEGMGPYRALTTALEYASCSGALVVAAAGNSEDPTCPESGPLAPAAFEQLAAPTSNQCAAKGFTSSVPYPIFEANAYRPLVHAVGGVTEYDTNLINGRLDAWPRVVALGSNAIRSYSGTSASTAVVAGIASLIWSYEPDLKPHEVMQIIYDAGYPLDPAAEADFGLGGGTLPDVHRASVCAALSAACSGAHCPTLGCTAQPPATDGNLGGYASVVDNVLAASNVDDGYTATPSTGDICDESQVHDNLGTPQPDTPVCEHCNVIVNKSDPQANGATTHNLNMTIASEHHGTITAATVLVTDLGGDQWKYEFDGDHDVIASLNNQLFPSIDVTHVLLDDLPSIRSASIIFTVVNEDDIEERSDEQITVAEID